MNEQQVIKIALSDLSVDEVNFILAGLQELPGKICNPLSMKIKTQAEAQLPKQEDAVRKLPDQQ
jgi:hypothetical protein